MPELLGQTQVSESSVSVAARVADARGLQLTRQKVANARLSNRELQKVCALNPATAALLEQATRVLGLSARAHHRVLKLARTIADLAAQPDVQLEHVSEAIALRALDRRQRLYPVTSLSANAAGHHPPQAGGRRIRK
jgi:magnesium chelatase family protein